MRGLPLLHEVRCNDFRHLLPRHSHNNIAVKPSFVFSDSSSWLQGYPSNLLQALTTCRVTSGTTTFTILGARGAQAPTLSTPSRALLSAPAWTTTYRRLSAHDQPLLLRSSNTGGSRVPPKQIDGTSGAHPCPHPYGPPFKCPCLDLLLLPTVWSSIQPW